MRTYTNSKLLLNNHFKLIIAQFKQIIVENWNLEAYGSYTDRNLASILTVLIGKWPPTFSKLELLVYLKFQIPN